MKYLIMFCILLLSQFSVRGQNWDEWFKQKKTQRKYLLRQIAGLKVYLGYLKEGYDIAQKGLTTIENIKEGNFNLHRDFFGSLKQVNPAIRNSAKVADIIALQIKIVREFKRLYATCQDDGNFTLQEIGYIGTVYSNMLKECDKSISELLMVITANETEMKDDERLGRIDDIYEDMKDKYAFTRSFGNTTLMLAMQRGKERSEIEFSRNVYGL